MQLGAILAILGAAGFGMAHVVVRRGVFRAGESFSSVPVTVFSGALLLGVAMLSTGDWGAVWSLSLQGWVLLSAAGILHFTIGRFLGFHAIRVIGANRATVLARSSLFYAVAFAVVFLHETLTPYIILGVLLMGVGGSLVSFEKEENVPGEGGRGLGGVLSGLGAGLFWGISPVLIRPAMAEIGSPLAATFISYAAASAVMVPICSRGCRWRQLAHLERPSALILVGAGALFGGGQLIRYMALSYAPVSIVNTLGATVVAFTFVFSFLINRRIELFNWKVIAGMLSTILGTFFMFL